MKERERARDARCCASKPATTRKHPASAKAEQAPHTDTDTSSSSNRAQSRANMQSAWQWLQRLRCLVAASAFAAETTHKNKLQNEQFIKLCSLSLLRRCLRSVCGSAWKWSSNTTMAAAAQTTTTMTTAAAAAAALTSASTLANAAKFHEWNL